jgi:hypothetical protein
VSINGAAATTCPPIGTAALLDCTYQVPDGQNVTVIAASTGESYSSPTSCETTGSTCSFTINADTTVTLRVT